MAACKKAGTFPPPGWSKSDPSVKPISTNDLSIFGESRRSLFGPEPDCVNSTDFSSDVGTQHSLGLAIHVYPMYENALRAYNKQTQRQNSQESAELYAEFDSIACSHPHSWRYGETPRDAQSIWSVTERNRLICAPCKIWASGDRFVLTKADPLLMNAFNTVNLAAACILTSAEHAEALSIPKDKWVYILGGAGTNDEENCEL